MKDNLREEDREIRDIVIVRNIPQEETYITPKSVHKRLQDWEEAVRTVSRIDLVAAVTDGVLFGYLLHLADAPTTNYFQKILAGWLIISRVIVASVFQVQMRKMEEQVHNQICKNGPTFSHPSATIELLSLVTAALFISNTGLLNQIKSIGHIIQPIEFLELMIIIFRMLSRLILDEQALKIVSDYKEALNRDDALPQQMVPKS